MSLAMSFASGRGARGLNFRNSGLNVPDPLAAMRALLAAAPTVGDDATDQQQIAARRRRRRTMNEGAPGTRGGTLLTGASGLGAPATTGPKTLLGL